MKKFIYILLFFITIFITKNVKAVSNFQFDTKVPDMYIHVSNGENTYDGQISVITLRGNYLYSLDPYSKLDGDINYAEYNYADEIFNISEQTASRINIIANYGYNYGNNTDIKWYAITQFLIWKELGQTEIYFTDSKGDKVNTYDTEISELEKVVDDFYKLPSFANGTHSFNINSSYELIDENNVLDNFYIDYSSVDATIDGNKLKINEGGNINTQINFANGSYDSAPSSFYHTTDYDGYQSLFKKGQKEVIEFSVRIKSLSGEIIITKKDKELLYDYPSIFKDSEYGLYDEKGLVTIIKLDEFGMGYVYDLKYGNYYLKELKPSVGYKIDSKIYEITIYDKYSHCQLELYGEKIKGNLIINKYYGNKNNYKLEDDAEFKIYTLDDISIGKYKTVDGKINITLPYGKYYIEQIKGKKGYKLVERQEFTIDEEKDYVIDLYNEEILIETSIYKYYGENHSFEPEDGAVFEIYNLDNELVGTYETVNGKADLKLPYGKYYTKQIKGKVGYKFAKDCYFEIHDEHPGNLYFYDEIIKPNILLNKYYGEKGNYKLEDGAEFELYDDSDNLINTYSTINGITFMKLPYGKYYLKQIKGKDGYKLIEKYEFIINEDKEYTIDLYNDKIYGNVLVNKYYGEKDNYKLESNAEFELYDKFDNLVDTYITSKGKIKLELPCGEYYLKQIKGKEGYKLIEKYKFIINEDKEYTIDLYNDKIYGNVLVNKYYGEKDNYKLEDEAEFKLYNKSKKLLGTYRIENGKLNITLPYGEYYLKQIKGKEGYKLIDRYDFIIDENKDYVINLYNDKIYGNLLINKYYGEKDNYKLEDGAEFKLYDEFDNLINTYSTIDGIIETNLPYGKYYLKQIKGNVGYKLIEKYEFIIDKDKEYTINLYNDKIYGNVLVNKYYGEKDNYKLESNAEFELYDKSGNLIDTYMTSKGKIKLELPCGEYYLKQIKGKEGYRLIDRYDFIIDENKDYVINLYNDKIYGNLLINKYYGEKDDYKLEDGAEFKLYNKSKKLLGTYRIENGKLNITLPYGEYYLKQIKGKEGYRLIDRYDFIIDENKDYVINLYNDKIYGNLLINKYYGEKDNYKLEDGAEFKLYDEFDNLINTYSTIDGIIEKNLPYGKYYLKQIKGNEGYKLIEKYEFIIDKDKDYVINLYNDKIYKKIEIKKYYGVKDNYKLEDGAEFELYDKSGNLIDIYITSKGKIKLELPYGEYYLIQTKGKEGYKLTEKQEIIIDDSTIENSIISLYDDMQEVVESAVLIVDVPNTYKKDYTKSVSIISIITGFIIILIGKTKKTI